MLLVEPCPPRAKPPAVASGLCSRRNVSDDGEGQLRRRLVVHAGDEILAGEGIVRGVPLAYSSDVSRSRQPAGTEGDSPAG